MILVTGASGQLGRLVIETLLESTAANQIVAAVRSPEKVSDLAERGVTIRHLDYSQPETIKPALAGVKKLLLISSSEIGSRLQQHINVINAAKETDVELFVYTSVLRADTSTLNLAVEHRETEAALAASGLPYTLLRNGWYSENYTQGIGQSLQLGGMIGCAGDGKFSMATRADYAEAAAAVLLSEGQAGQVYELAGDEGITLTQFAAKLGELAGKTIGYQNMPEAAFAEILTGAGLPAPLVSILAQSETSAAQGELYDDSKTLSKLIGRPTTSLSDSIQAALDALAVSDA